MATRRDSRERRPRRGKRGPGPRVGLAWRARLQRRATEAYESVRIVAAFVAFSALLGLTQPGDGSGGQNADAAASPNAAARPTPPGVATLRETTPTRWLVDGFNVLNVGLLRGAEREHFWGPDARARLLALADRFPDAARVVVVFDGGRPVPVDGGGGPGTGGATYLFAPDADAWLLRAVRDSDDPGRVAVVTADRRLADRARHRGAQVVSPARFLDACGAQAQPAARLVSLDAEGDDAG